ncbi:MAG TPA: MDR family MFS transporter [Candidatus Limnocylindrales bacterium]|nr:MDR family MFS transporter [Candidatus Limnocylindrales bacterium]
MTDQSRLPRQGGLSGTPDTTGRPALEVDPRTRFEILAAILLGLFLAALDQTIVGTALPRIVTELHGNELYTWVVTVYLLTSTVTGPIYGKLSDLFGRRPLLLIGIGLFLVGSFLSGLSQEMWQLILFRGIQGLGAGALFPIALAVIGDLFTPAERGKYQGVFGAVFGVAAIIGPWLGGLLTDHVSWHWVFFVNLPIGAVSLVIIARLLPSIRRPGASRDIDYLGAAVFSAGIVPVLIGLTNKQSGGWGDAAVAWPIVGGLAILGLFLLVEARAREPMIPLGLFRNRTFSLSMVAVFMASIGFFGAIVFLPLYLQVVRGVSATESGWNLLPFMGGLILGSIASGQVVARTGRYRWLTVGALLLVGAGMVLLTNLRADTPLPVLWGWMFLTGIGVGPTMAVFTIIVQNAVPFDKLGAATSDLTLGRQIGGTIGLTLAFSLFRQFLDRDLISRELVTAGVPAQLVASFPASATGGAANVTSVALDQGAALLAEVPERLRPMVAPFLPQIVAGMHSAVSIAISQTFWLGVAAAAIGAVLTVALREMPLRRTHAPAAAAAHVGQEALPAAD